MIAVHWYIPLPDPVGLREGQPWSVESPFTSPNLVKVSTVAIQLEGAFRPAHDTDVLMTAARMSLPGMPEGGSTESSNLTAPVTVMEMVAIYDNEPDETQIALGFDEGLELVRRVLASYRQVTKDPIRLPSRESFPSAVPFTRRHPSHESPGFPGDFGLFLVNSDSLRASSRPDLTEQQHEQIGRLFTGSDKAFSGYLALSLDARRYFSRDGDYRGSVLAAATAAEALLMEALMHASWETGEAPETMAEKLKGPQRIRDRFPQLASLFGGTWDVQRAEALRDWDIAIAAVRNSVVHAGYAPTLAEARAAMDALGMVERFFVARLLDDRNRKRLIRTVLAFCGWPGLESRGLASNKLRAHVESLPSIDQSEVFARWKSSVLGERLRLANRGEQPDASRANIYWVRHPSGQSEWVAHDPSAGYACLIDDEEAQLNEQVRANLEGLRRDLDQSPPTERVSCQIDGVTGATCTGPWKLPHHLLPNCGVRSDGVDMG